MNSRYFLRAVLVYAFLYNCLFEAASARGQEPIRTSALMEKLRQGGIEQIKSMLGDLWLTNKSVALEADMNGCPVKSFTATAEGVELRADKQAGGLSEGAFPLIIGKPPSLLDLQRCRAMDQLLACLNSGSKENDQRLIHKANLMDHAFAEGFATGEPMLWEVRACYYHENRVFGLVVSVAYKRSANAKTYQTPFLKLSGAQWMSAASSK